MLHKLAIITTHPIQYYAPVFRLLTEEGVISVKVFYTYEKVKEVYDDGFGKSFTWDIPLLEGYNYTFVSNNGNERKGFFDVTNPSLNREIEDWGATALLVFGWNFKSHLSAMRYFKGKIPVLFRGDSTLLDEVGGIKKTLRRMFLSWVYQHVDCALYVGEANKRYYKYCGLKENQLIFAPHAIDNARFASIDESQQNFIEETKKAFQISDAEITFVFCGKFQSKKNPLALLSAFKQIPQENAHLIFVGNGELETEMKQKASEDKRIHFLPFQNQSLMPAVYRLGQVFCLPSSGPGETWGLAVNEAMACSRAIIVSDKCGCAENLVENGYNGLIFKNAEHQTLLIAMKKYIDGNINARLFGDKSYTKIQDWNYKNITRAIYSILNP